MFCFVLQPGPLISLILWALLFSNTNAIDCNDHPKRKKKNLYLILWDRVQDAENNSPISLQSQLLLQCSVCPSFGGQPPWKPGNPFIQVSVQCTTFPRVACFYNVFFEIFAKHVFSISVIWSGKTYTLQLCIFNGLENFCSLK